MRRVNFCCGPECPWEELFWRSSSGKPHPLLPLLLVYPKSFPELPLAVSSALWSRWDPWEMPLERCQAGCCCSQLLWRDGLQHEEGPAVTRRSRRCPQVLSNVTLRGIIHSKAADHELHPHPTSGKQKWALGQLCQG